MDLTMEDVDINIVDRQKTTEAARETTRGKDRALLPVPVGGAK